MFLSLLTITRPSSPSQVPIRSLIHVSIMQSSIVALALVSLFVTIVQCNEKQPVSEYIIKQGLLSGGRSYEIQSQTNAPSRFTVRNELFSIGKKLTLLQDGEPRYTVKHDILNLMSTWTIIESKTDKEVGTIKNQLRLFGSKMEANGSFGSYVITGNFGNRSFTIKKAGEKVAHIEKKSFHLHDTYGLTVYGNADQALMILFAIIVDEIREH